MYTEEYERRGFPIRNFLIKLFLIILFILLLLWLLPKIISPSFNSAKSSNSLKDATDTSTVVSSKSKKSKDNSSSQLDSSVYSQLDALTSQIFAQNIDRMKDAAISYYTDERLPKEVGESDTMTLSDMIGKKIILALIDKNNKACDVEKSYVKITKVDDEYILKVNLKDSEKEDYILVHLGCYTYCEGAVCQKHETTVNQNVPVKGSKVTDYVPIKGTIKDGEYIAPKKKSKVIPTDTAPKCKYKNGKYYDSNGYVVSKVEYIKQCLQPQEQHICVKYDGDYYGKDGKIVSKATYLKECTKEEKHICVKYDGDYYGKDGKIVSKSTYLKECSKEEKHYCVKYNGDYYGKDGKIVSKATYLKECTKEEKHICVKYNGDYYGSDGKVVSKETYIKQCTKEEKHYCVKYNGDYYGSDGKVVSKETYIKQCTSEPAKEYIYEYKKTTGASMSDWSTWSAWSKTKCSTAEINCSDNDVTCLKKLQMLKRKEQIGTYDKTYAKTRQVVKQTGSYTQKACSKYNYVEINKTVYATTTNYTTVNTITTTTRQSAGSWTYNGRKSYSNPPRDSANTHYQFVGANYDPCSSTCTSLPDYYYDSYTYNGGLSSVSSTTSTPYTTSSSSTTTSSTTTSTDASCGAYEIKTIPIYSTITVTEKATRTEPLYGTVCYQSTKTRKVISSGTTKTKWSTYNDSSLINSGWEMTGNKKLK